MYDDHGVVVDKKENKSYFGLEREYCTLIIIPSLGIRAASLLVIFSAFYFARQCIAHNGAHGAGRGANYREEKRCHTRHCQKHSFC